jgi:hypothetical protein
MADAIGTAIVIVHCVVMTVLCVSRGPSDLLAIDSGSILQSLSIAAMRRSSRIIARVCRRSALASAV